MLDEFIRHKLANYQEPTRRGTPKGEKIGFGRAKYASSLRLLNSAGIRDIAADVDVSVGLLRKWMTEKDFKAQIKRNAEAFIDDLVSVLREQSKKDQRAWEKFLTSPFEEGEKAPESVISDKIIADIDHWGKPIAQALLNRWEQMGDEAIDAMVARLERGELADSDEDNWKFHMSRRLARIYDAFLKSQGRKPKFREMLDSMHGVFVKHRILAMADSLDKGENLSHRDRRLVAYELRQIAKTIVTAPR